MLILCRLNRFNRAWFSLSSINIHQYSPLWRRSPYNHPSWMVLHQHRYAVPSFERGWEDNGDPSTSSPSHSVCTKLQLPQGLQQVILSSNRKPRKYKNIFQLLSLLTPFAQNIHSLKVWDTLYLQITRFTIVQLMRHSQNQPKNTKNQSNAYRRVLRQLVQSWQSLNINMASGQTGLKTFQSK